MRRPIRLGLIGTGVAARRLYLPAWRKLGTTFELHACTNRTREKALAYARLAGFAHVARDARELMALPELDAIVVSLPIDRQPQVVRAALALGKPVLSEKPIAPTLTSGRRLIEHRKRVGTPWLVGENYAFLDSVARLERWLEQGRLGDVLVVEVRQLVLMNLENPYFHTSWRRAPRFSGSFVLDAGVHLAHVVRRCFGMPTEVRAMTAGLTGLPPPDTAVASLRFACGALGTWTSCFGVRDAGPPLRVLGSRYTAELHFDHIDLVDSRGGRRRHETNGDGFTAQFAHFAQMVRSGKPPRVSPEEALLDLELALCIARPEGARRAPARALQRSRASIK